MAVVDGAVSRPALLAFVVATCAALCAQEVEIPEVREFDYIRLKSGAVQVGTIEKVTVSETHFKPRDNPTHTLIIQNELIDRVWRRQSPKEAYRARLKKMKSPKAEDYLALAKWAMRYPDLYEQAREALHGAVKMRPKDVTPYKLLVLLVETECARRNRAPTEAESDLMMEVLDAALALEDPDLCARWAEAMAESGFVHDGVEMLERLLKKGGTDAAVERRLLLAHAALTLRDAEFDKALASAEEVLSTDAEDAAALMLKARAEFALGKTEDAAATLVSLKEKAPLWWKPHALEGALKLTADDFAGAAGAFEEALRLRSPEVGLLCDLAQALMMSGRVHTARTRLDEALRLAGGAWRPHYLKALTARILGDADEEETSLRNAAADPAAPAFVHFALAQALAARGSYKDALDYAAGALKAGHPPAQAHTLRAAVLLAGGDHKGAERALLAALAADPKFADAYAVYGRLCVAMKRRAEALRRFAEALRCDPSHVDALRNLAYIHFARGEYERASAYVERLKQIPGAADAFLRRAAKVIDEAKTLLLWRDGFDRADSLEVKNGWEEEGEIQGGAEAQIKQRSLLLEDPGKGGELEVFRSEKTAGLVRVEAALDVASAPGVDCGLMLARRDDRGTLRAWIGVWVGADGSVWYNYSEKGPSGELPLAPPVKMSGTEVVLALELTDEKEGLWTVLVDHKEVAQIKKKTLLRALSAECALTLYVKADSGKTYKAFVKWVRVFRRPKKEGGR